MSWLYNARRYVLDFQTRFKNLENQFNAKITNDSADEGEDLQTSSEGHLGKSYLKFCDHELSSITVKNDTQPSMFTFEPDYDTCKLWVEFDSLGATVNDYSGFSHTAKTCGIGRVHNGIDYGFTQSVESIFDGRSCYAEIANHSDIRVSSISSGFSLFFRFLPFSLDESGGYRQVPICKVDIADTDWWSFEIAPDGKARFNLTKASDVYSIVTPAETIQAVPYNELTTETPRYDVAVTFDLAEQDLRLFINNTKYDTVSSSLDSETQQPSATLNNHLNVGRWTDIVSPTEPGEKYALRANSRLYHGVFQQLKFFQDLIATDAEVGYHYTNKCSISDIPFGRAAAAGTMVFGEDEEEE